MFTDMATLVASQGRAACVLACLLRVGVNSVSQLTLDRFRRDD
jgi:hypothetical protein